MPTGYLHQADQVTNQRIFQNARIGFDGYINNHNTLSLSENGVFGQFTTTDNATIALDSANGNEMEKENIIQYSTGSFSQLYNQS